MKICSKCQVEKEETDFGKDSRHASGKSPYCKYCLNNKNKSYAKLHPDKNRLRQQRLRKEHPDKAREYRRTQRAKHRDTINQKCKVWCKNNREKINAYRKEKYEKDPEYKLSVRLRTRLRDALKGRAKAGSAIRDMGCTLPELVLHLERQFQPGMTWNNYGKGIGKWNVDHIRPLVSFRLQEREELLKAVNFTNLQPLWEIDNTTKSITDRLWKASQ